MSYFRFSCDTNILISSSFFYRFKTFKEIFREGRIYELSIFIMRYFEYILKNTGKKYGILPPSTFKELEYKKITIILRKLEEKYSNDEEKFNKALKELSTLLNKVNDNLKRIFQIFIMGRAYFNDGRVKKIYQKVDNMYNDFIEQSLSLKEAVKEKVTNHINNFYKMDYEEIEALQEIEEAKEMARQTQISRLSNPDKTIDDKDKEILAEIVYERKRFIQENPSLKNNLNFYFITEDTHFSRKYNKRFSFYSTPITDRIEDLFNVKCVRAKQFTDLIIKKKLDLSK
ncbi:MAG: hypothetical protein ACTSQU_12035 [Promethearchaeota archaeon]